MIGSGEHAAKEDNTPKLLRKGQQDPYAPKAEGKEGEGGGAASEIEGEGGSQYRTSYFRFSDDFTSNLKNSTALVQMSLACSTHRDGRVLMWLKKHELAIRSEILVTLADTPEEDSFTPDGKVRIAKRLTSAINKVLTEAEGFGGVDQVYFKSFLVQ
ncbi:MAG: flagellar basal body-associated FliL family protein [Sphingomonadales bacterium]|nr:flagellar basal body-associated FliL family protein [Sphingomonadales bacterium]